MSRNFISNCIKRSIEFSEDNYMIAQNVKKFKQFIKENWHHVAIQNVKANEKSDMFVGNYIQIEAVIKLEPINPEKVIVEIVYGKESGSTLENINTIDMKKVEQTAAGGVYRYRGSLKVSQRILGYTVRVRPANGYFTRKFELPFVTWAENF